VLIILSSILAALQIRLWSGERSFSEIAYLENRIKFKEIAIKAQVIQNKQITSQVDDLMNGKSAVEEISRSELMLILPGEEFVIITGERRVQE